MQAHVDVVGKVNDAVLNDGLELLLVDSECGLNLLERVHEVLAHDLDLVNVVRNAGKGSDLVPKNSVSA